MENEIEYKFNYDEIKRIFESVPYTNTTTKKRKPASYKTHFQARTKLSVADRKDKPIQQAQTNTNSTMINQVPSPVSFITVQTFHVYQILAMGPFYLQTQHDFYVISNNI